MRREAIHLVNEGVVDMEEVDVILQIIASTINQDRDHTLADKEAVHQCNSQIASTAQ